MIFFSKWSVSVAALGNGGFLFRQSALLFDRGSAKTAS